METMDSQEDTQNEERNAAVMAAIQMIMERIEEEEVHFKASDVCEVNGTDSEALSMPLELCSVNQQENEDKCEQMDGICENTDIESMERIVEVENQEVEESGDTMVTQIKDEDIISKIDEIINEVSNVGGNDGKEMVTDAKDEEVEVQKILESAEETPRKDVEEEKGEEEPQNEQKQKEEGEENLMETGDVKRENNDEGTEMEEQEGVICTSETSIDDVINEAQASIDIESMWNARKYEIEVEAEKRASILSQKWIKEKKSIEAAIDESLKDYGELYEKAHALRLQFEHDKREWQAKITQMARNMTAMPSTMSQDGMHDTYSSPSSTMCPPSRSNEVYGYVTKYTGSRAKHRGEWGEYTTPPMFPSSGYPPYQEKGMGMGWMHMQMYGQEGGAWKRRDDADNIDDDNDVDQYEEEAGEEEAESKFEYLEKMSATRHFAFTDDEIEANTSMIDQNENSNLDNPIQNSSSSTNQAIAEQMPFSFGVKRKFTAPTPIQKEITPATQKGKGKKSKN